MFTSERKYLVRRFRFLVVNVFYRDSSQQVVNFVSSNYRVKFSYCLREKLDTYLGQLYKEGWELTRTQSFNKGTDEAYFFRHIVE